MRADPGPGALPFIGKVIDEAMTAIEREKPQPQGRAAQGPSLDKPRLGELVKAIGDEEGFIL